MRDIKYYNYKICMKENLSNTENGVLESSIPQDEVNNSSLYLDETDSKGVSLLRRVEKYPDLPENEFIPVEYTHSNGVTVENNYYVNKLGQIKNIETGRILKPSKQKGYLSIRFFHSKLIFMAKVHRVVASTFLYNPNLNTYNVVNHIDHNPSNNNISNLEWITLAENSNVANGKRNRRSIDKLMNYIALDDSGNELFSVNKYNNKGYNTDNIAGAIFKGHKYHGYKWKRSRKTRKEATLELTGFSGNVDDYEWFDQPRFPGLMFVCREGFIKDNTGMILGFKDEEGYVKINFKGYSLLAHRLIMECKLGRLLETHELVDHINTVRYDNNFENLRLTDVKGNMNNPITIDKKSKKIIASDLFGNFISYDTGKNMYVNLLPNIKTNKSGYVLVKNNFPGDKYIFIEPGDKENLLNKMKLVTYVFDSNMKVVDAFISYTLFKKEKGITISRSTVDRHLNSGKIAPDGNYYMRGEEAVELIITQGHGKAWEFESNKQN